MHSWTFLSAGFKVMRIKCPSWRCVWEMSFLCKDSLKIVEIYLSVDFVMVGLSGCNCYYQLPMSDRGFQTELNCQCNEGSFKFIWWDLFLSSKISIHTIFYTTVCSWLRLLGLLESSTGVREPSGITPRCPLPFFHQHAEVIRHNLQHLARKSVFCL